MHDRTSLIYGLQPVREALKAGRRIRSLYLHRNRSGATRALVEAARSQGVQIVETSRKALSAKVGSPEHQGVVAELIGGGPGPDANASVDDILAVARERAEAPLVLVVDGVQDPRNLGALIRTAHALGAHGVVIPKDRAASLTPTAVKASAGAAAHVLLARVTNLKRALDELEAGGVWSAAATLDGAPLTEARLDGPLAIVVGAEGRGIRKTVAARCDTRVSIPLAGGFDSLNVSVAAGILLHEARRQRGG